MPENKGYVLSWLAFVFLMLLISFSTLIIFLQEDLSLTLRIIIIICWVPGIASIIFLFRKASGNILKSVSGETPASDQPKTKPLERIQSSEQLDVKGVANKVVRRISLETPVEQWSDQLLNLLVNELEIMAGLVYAPGKKGIFESVAMYAYPHAEAPYTFKEGEGLTGQVVRNRQLSVYHKLPEAYDHIFSGLGSAKPAYLAIIPLEVGGKVIAVVEIAGFRYASENLEQLFQLLAREIINKIQQKPAGTDKKTAKEDEDQ